MHTYIIDTNFFFNLEIKSGFGNNPKEIILKLTEIGKELKKTQKGELFMPPKVVDEFLSFVTLQDEHIKDFLSVMTVKSPDISSIQFPAQVFYDLVEEMRHRAYRGLQVAEEEMLRAGKAMLEKKDLTHIEYQKSIGEHVKKLRDHYRQATRVKFLDSVADLELIVLARELNGTLVTSDEGVSRWGRAFGVKEIAPQVLLKQLQVLLVD